MEHMVEFELESVLLVIQHASDRLVFAARVNHNRVMLLINGDVALSKALSGTSSYTHFHTVSSHDVLLVDETASFTMNTAETADL